MKSRRRSFEPTPEQRQAVLQETGCGATQKQLAGALGITMKTLRKHFPKELKDGRAWANKMVAKSLFWQATVGKNTTAAIWWEKTRSGMHEKLALEHSANTVPPPQLGISFAAGGPGLERTEPYSVETDDSMNTPPGQDRLPGSEPVPVETPRPAQEFIPRLTQDPTTPPPTSIIEEWEKFGQERPEFLPSSLKDVTKLPEEDWGAAYAREARARGRVWGGRGSG
jgi:hypothetical protein